MMVKRFLKGFFDKWDIITIPYIMFVMFYYGDILIWYRLLLLAVGGAIILHYTCVFITTCVHLITNKKTKKGDEEIMSWGMCSLDKESAIAMHEEKRAEGFTVTFDLRKGA